MIFSNKNKIHATILTQTTQIREQKIEKCFEEFRATVQRAIDANQSLEQQADAYASQIRSDQTKRLKELHRSSKRTYDKLHNLFGITFARQHLSRQRVELKKLEEWSNTHALELKRSTSSRAENIKSIAHAIEQSTRDHISTLKKRLCQESRLDHQMRLRDKHVKMIRDVTHQMLLAERQSMEKISNTLSAHSETLKTHKERVMEDLIRMVQASVLEETKVNNRLDLESIRKRRFGVIENALSTINREIESKRVSIEHSVNAHARSISQEVELRIKKMKLETRREIDVLKMLYGSDVANEFESNAKVREDFELRERFEGERQILNLLGSFLPTTRQ